LSSSAGRKSEFPFRNPAGNQHDVEFREDVPQPVLDLRLHIVQVKPFDAGIAGREQGGAQRVVVAPADLVRRDSGIDLDEFVHPSRRPHLGNLADRQRRITARSGHANLAAVSLVPTRTTTSPAR